jgi:hypothetical protein
VKPNTRSTQSAFVLLAAFLLPQLSAQTPSRLPVAIEGEPRFVLTHNTPPRIASAVDLGPVDDSFVLPRMTLHFRLAEAQQKELDQLVHDQQDRTSAEYHKWLTPDEFGQRFGLNDADLAAVRSWLQSEGFTDIDAAPGRNMMTFRGTAGQAGRAFRTTLRRYRVGSETHYSNSSDAELPAVLRGVVAAIRGLHDFRPKPAFNEVLQSQVMHALTPSDLATIYDCSAALRDGDQWYGPDDCRRGGERPHGVRSNRHAQLPCVDGPSATGAASFPVWSRSWRRRGLGRGS